MRRLDIALDVGGEFCDLVAWEEGGAPLLLKRPADHAMPPGEMLRAMLDAAGIAPGEVARLRLSTTLATNALVNGTAGPVALVATRGFADVPDLGRQSRRDPQDDAPPPPTPPSLSPPGLRMEVGGRIGAHGQEVAPLPPADIAACLDRLSVLPPGAAVAVCLLFAHLDPRHELALAAAIAAARPDLHISLSHQVDPAPREFERMLATLADAALKPLIRARLHGLRPAPWVMRAAGTLAPLEAAAAHPLGLALSGPASGARAVAHWSGGGDAIGFEMGGTTTEISLVRAGTPLTAGEVGLGALRLRCPALDVESLQLGGSTRIALGAGGLQLGPAARPACRGGGAPTLADAALLAGWLPPVLSGVALDRDRAAAALREALGTEDGTPALLLAEASAAEALRRIALRRGLDPTRTLLVAGGGAGPLHAAAVAARIGARRVLVPPAAGLLSATGLALAPAGAETARALDLPLAAVATLGEAAAEAAREVSARLAASGLSGRLRHALSIAHAGGAEPLEVPFDPGETAAALAARFDAAHEAARGHAAGGERRILALRTRAEAPLAAPPGLPRQTPAPPRPGALPRAELISAMPGPVLLDGPDATVRVPAGWRAVPRPDGALLLERA